MTPEGRVKAAVRKAMAPYKSQIYTHWPVPYGYGQSTLDCIGCINGHFFAVETKAPGQVPTKRQEMIIGEIQRAGGTVFVIDGVDKTQELEAFLERVSQHVPSPRKRKTQADRRPTEA